MREIIFLEDIIDGKETHCKDQDSIKEIDTPLKLVNAIILNSCEKCIDEDKMGKCVGKNNKKHHPGMIKIRKIKRKAVVLMAGFTSLNL